MQWYYVVLIVLGIITFLLLLPIFFGGNIYFNMKENLGVVMLTFWGVPVVCFQIQVKKAVITIIKRKGKEKEVPIKLIDTQMIFGEFFVKSIFNFLIIQEINVFMTVGKENDAFISNMIGGGVLDFLYAVLSVLFTKKGEIKTYIDVETLTTENQIKATLKAKVIINLLIIIAGLCRAKRLTKKVVRLYERLSRKRY